MITTQRMSLGSTSLIKDQMNHFVLNPTTHDVAALLIPIKDIFLDYHWGQRVTYPVGRL